MEILNGNTYIVSDCHFGAPNNEASHVREQRFCQFLDQIKPTVKHLILLGDIFDYWFDYKEVVPRGYVRLFGKLAELSDQGVSIIYFIGNHDMWITDYFKQEFNAKIYRTEQEFEINGKYCKIAHGDGLGPKDYGYKLVKKIFACPFNRWLFAQLHPWLSFKIARAVCRTSRRNGALEENIFMGEDREYIVQHIREVLKNQTPDYFIYAHRHLPLVYPLTPQSLYLNTGDWLTHFSYIEIIGQHFELKYDIL